MKLFNKYNWVSSTKPSNKVVLNELEKKMRNYYSATTNTYYDDIDFTGNVWMDSEKLPQQDILAECMKGGTVLEVGCGKANILRNNVSLQPYYTGVDFSLELMHLNKALYPQGTFDVILDGGLLPFNDAHFDVVFSHFVIEHACFPSIFLNESVRVLKPNGLMIILCPDFSGFNYIPSQRVGFSQGSGREKLQKKKILDAVITGIDTRVIMPLICTCLKNNALKSPKFYINLTPTCFTDSYIPDVDAVYLTNAAEIKMYCSVLIEWLSLDEPVDNYCKKNKLIYLKGKKQKK